MMHLPDPLAFVWNRFAVAVVIAGLFTLQTLGKDGDWS